MSKFEIPKKFAYLHAISAYNIQMSEFSNKMTVIVIIRLIT